MIARELPKILSESIEKPYPQGQRLYLAILDIDLKIIKIGLKANQNFSFYPLLDQNLTLPWDHYL